MLINNKEYLNIVDSIKSEIKNAQYRATVSFNQEMVMLYYNIGKVINEHKIWGNKFIENLAADIRMDFPKAKGYSVRNLKYMSKYAATYSDVQWGCEKSPTKRRTLSGTKPGSVFLFVVKLIYYEQ